MKRTTLYIQDRNDDVDVHVDVDDEDDVDDDDGKVVACEEESTGWFRELCERSARGAW